MFEMQRWDKVRRYRCSNLDDHIPNVRLCIKSKVSSYCYSRLQKGIGATARANRNIEARTSHTRGTPVRHPRQIPSLAKPPSWVSMALQPCLKRACQSRCCAHSAPPKSPAFAPSLSTQSVTDAAVEICPRILICGQNKSH